MTQQRQESLVLQIRAEGHRFARLIAVNGVGSEVTASFDSIRAKVYSAFAVADQDSKVRLVEDQADHKGYALTFVDEKYGEEVAITSEDEWKAYLLLACGSTSATESVKVKRFKWMLCNQLGSLQSEPQAADSQRNLAPRKQEVAAATARDSPYDSLEVKSNAQTVRAEKAETQSISTPQPRFAFHSVEPQKPGEREERMRKDDEMRRRFERQVTETINREREEDQPEQAEEQTARADAEMVEKEGAQMSAFDRMMARSRAQGEALNHAFGSIQARRAGNALTSRQQEQEQADQQSQPSVSSKANDDPLPASQDSAQHPQASDAPNSKDRISKQNDYLAERWSERLQQMGHGGQPSPYGMLRNDTARHQGQENYSEPQYPATSEQSTTENTMSNAEGSSSNEVEGYQIVAPIDESQQRPLAVPMLMPHVPDYADEELEALPAIDAWTQSGPPQTLNAYGQPESSVPHSQSQPFPTLSRPSSRQEDEGRLTSTRAQTVPRGPTLGEIGRPSLNDIAWNGQHNDSPNPVLSSPTFAVRASPVMTSSEGLSGGAETPNRFGSFGRKTKGKGSILASSPRSRKLSVRSLTEALMNRASSSTTSASSHSPAGVAEDGDASSSAAASTSGQRRPKLHVRHMSWKGLTGEVNAVKSSFRLGRGPTTGSSPYGNMEASDIQPRRDVEVATQDSPADTVESQGSIAPELEDVNAASTKIRPEDCSATNSRPSLLRASQSAPLSSTAVNLTSAGGITLHVSSVGRFPIDHHHTNREDAPHSASPTPKDLFDLMLPRELRVACMRALVRLHEEEHERLVLNGQWRGVRAREARHFGQEAAMRELVRLSRVSRTWQSLLFDGQLWSAVDASLVAGMSDGTLLRIVKNSGAFVKQLNLAGRAELKADMLVALGTQQRNEPSSPSLERSTKSVGIASGRKRMMTRKLSLLNEKEQLSLLGLATSLSSLTTINLQGCRTISTQALHHLLVRTPNLEEAILADMTASTNDTLALLGVSASKLTKLDISRCENTDANGLNTFLWAAQERMYLANAKDYQSGQRAEFLQLPLRELYCSGLRGTDETLLTTIGRALQNVRCLDFSYCFDLLDSSIEALVAHTGSVKITPSKSKLDHSDPYRRGYEDDAEMEGPYVTLSPREAGGNILSDDVHHRRVFHRLCHLNFSSCRSLTDRACTLLAYAVPNLAILELANIGASIKDAGLVRLLGTTPNIQKLDLEGAIDITAMTIAAITPEVGHQETSALDTREVLATEGVLEQVNRSTSRSSARRSSRRSLPMRDQPEAPVTAAMTKYRHRHQLPPSPGSQLTHLILSHASAIEPASLLQLIRRCPNLIHLEADDTRANEIVAREFVTLARQRQKQGNYISVVDCRGLTLAVNRELNSHAAIRPRQGMRGPGWAKELGVYYEDPDVNPLATRAMPVEGIEYQQSDNGIQGNGSASTLPSRQRGGNQELALQSLSTYGECEPSMVVFKSFWGWESVDVRTKARKKLEAKKNAANFAQSRAASLTAVLGLGLGMGIVTGSREDGATDAGEGGDGPQHQHQQAQQRQDGNRQSHRWGRLSTGLLNPGDEADDARACLIM